MNNKRLSKVFVVVLLLSILSGSLVFAEDFMEIDEGIVDEPIKPVSIAADMSHKDDELENGMILDMANLVILDARLGDIEVPITFDVSITGGTFESGEVKLVGDYVKVEDLGDSHKRYILDTTKIDGEYADLGDLALDLDVKVGELASGDEFKVVSKVYIGDDLLDEGEFVAYYGDEVFGEYADELWGDDVIEEYEGLDEEYNERAGIEEIDDEELDELVEEEIERLEKEEAERDKEMAESNKEFEEEQEKKKTKRAGLVATFGALVVLFSIAYVTKKNKDE